MTNKTHEISKKRLIAHQLIALLAFSTVSYSLWWYLTIIEREVTIFNAFFLLSGLSGNITPWFSALVAPSLMLIGAFAHIDKGSLGGGSQINRDDEDFGQAGLYEKVGVLALSLNILAGGFSASYLITLYTVDLTATGIAGLLSSWLAFGYVVIRTYLRLVK